jgi:hexosaminidase
MKLTGLIVSAFLLCLTARAVAQTPTARPAPTVRHALMPVPASLEFGTGRLAVDDSFSFELGASADNRLRAAVDRMVARLKARTALQFPAMPAASGSGARLVIDCAQATAPPVPQLGDDESYAIDIDGTRALLKAGTVTGAIRGLETLLQLLDGDRQGSYFPAVRIDDRPRFPWRGLMIDIARHWMPMDVIKRNIDGMAAVKLNVLHLHITEDQGFRVESRKYPKLHQLGSDGLYYTQDQMREIVRYAADRGIRVVPEFDMPGHATSWLVGHPELASAPGPYQIERNWGIFDPTLDPTKEATYRLLDGFLGEMAAIFPDKYMHIGGDENNGKQWAANVEIQAFMKRRNLADAHALQAHFNQRVSKILTKYGKRMVGWDEILHPDLPKDIVVQSWRGQESLAQGAQKGYAGLLSNGYYLDYLHPAEQHYLVDPLPADTPLTPEQQKLILGGEACMWAEFVSPETIDSRIWPRMAAIAERFWSPGTVRDVEDMYRRLDVVSAQLEETGLLHQANPPVMLRRLAGGADPRPLEILTSVVEPVKVYNRPQQRPANQMMPLTRLVDVATADAPAARPFNTTVDRFLAHAGTEVGASALVAAFERWRSIKPSIDVLIDQSPALAEVRPLADDLAALAAVGLEAVSYLRQGVVPAPEWHASASARIEAAGKPKGQLEFAILPAMKRLVDAAGAKGAKPPQPTAP